eukprot:jgi/Tetstr1/423210/TSEL_001330.t1
MSRRAAAWHAASACTRLPPLRHPVSISPVSAAGYLRAAGRRTPGGRRASGLGRHAKHAAGAMAPASFLFTSKQLEEESPSRRDGVDAEVEAQMRRNYGDLLQKAGEGLKIPQPTIATAVVFCHRYFAVKSMKRNDRFIVATACLFLACKVEECLRRVQKVLEMCYSVRYKMDLNDVRTVFQDNKNVFEMLRENVLVAERALLYTLGFNFRIEKPYQHITARALRFQGVEPEGVRFLTQIAWNFVNDSLHTTLLLQHQPKHIAYSALYLAATFIEMALPEEEGRPWYENDGIPVHVIIDITKKMLGHCEKCAASAQARISSHSHGGGGSGRKREAPGGGGAEEGRPAQQPRLDGARPARLNSSPDVEMEIEGEG